MLIKDAERIAEKITELERKREIAKSIRGFQTRVEKLETPLQRLKLLVAILTQLQERGIAVDLTDCSSATYRLSQHIVQIQSDFEANPESILETDEQLRHQFWELLETNKFPKTVQTTLLKAWQHHSDTLIPARRTDLLDTMVMVPALKSDANKIHQLYKEVRDRRQRLPQAASDFDRLQTIRAELDRLWQRFGDDVIPEEVLKFLRAASSSTGARFNHLTPVVLDWLKGHDLEQSVRIVF